MSDPKKEAMGSGPVSMPFALPFAACSINARNIDRQCWARPGRQPHSDKEQCSSSRSDSSNSQGSLHGFRATGAQERDQRRVLHFV